jgi:hypothetical protein
MLKFCLTGLAFSHFGHERLIYVNFSVIAFVRPLVLCFPTILMWELL